MRRIRVRTRFLPTRLPSALSKVKDTDHYKVFQVIPSLPIAADLLQQRFEVIDRCSSPVDFTIEFEAPVKT